MALSRTLGEKETSEENKKEKKSKKTKKRTSKWLRQRSSRKFNSEQEGLTERA